MENYFRTKGTVDDAVKVNTALMFFIDITLLWWRDRNTDKRQCEIGTWQEFQCELKGQFYPNFIKEEARAKLQGLTQRGILWVKQEIEQRGVQKLSKAMTLAESVVKLGLGKDKLRSLKSEERGVCKKNHKEDVVDSNGNGDNGGNGKPRVGKKKFNGRMDNLKYFLWDVPHLLKKCLKKSVLSKKEKPMSKVLGLGLSARDVEAKEVESEKKLVECFLCHGPYRLRKSPRKSVIKGDDGADKEPKKLSSSKGKFEAKRAKRSKKKRIEYFLCRSPHKLQNCPK
ncbi:hypothetical protein Gotur_011566 [Gossypium turneri]